MKKINHIRVLWSLFVGILIVLASCSETQQVYQTVVATSSDEQILSQLSPTLSASAPISTQKVTVIPTAQSSRTLDPTKAYRLSFIYPPTPYPTLNAEELTQMIDLLQSDRCNLPCYLGITPGQTTWEEAKALLERVGAYFSFNTDENGLTIHNVKLDVGKENLASVTPDTEMGAGELNIDQSLQFTIDDGKVQKISVRAFTYRFISEFHEYWSRFSLWEILLQFGVPNNIYTGTPQPGATGTSIILVYDELGIVVTRNATIRGSCIHTGVDQISVDLYLTLTNTASQLSLYQPGTVPPTDREIYLPIQEVLGVDETEFYNQLISDPTTCFEIKQTDPSP